jgi:hypothetical protein
MEILVVEDEAGIADFLERGLDHRMENPTVTIQIQRTLRKKKSHTNMTKGGHPPPLDHAPLDANDRQVFKHRKISVLSEDRGVVSQRGGGNPCVVEAEAAPSRQFGRGDAGEATRHLGIDR